MIKRAMSVHPQAVKECWRKCFTMVNPNYADFLFANVFDPENCFVDEENGVVAAMAMCNPHAIMMNGRVLQASMISNVCVAPDYRNQGRERALVETVMDVCRHRELITLLPASMNNLFLAYGFEPVFHRTDYVLTRKDVKATSLSGCVLEPDPIDLLKVYSAFIRRFNGYYARDLKDFMNLKKDVNARGGRIVAWYDENKRIQGYGTVLNAGKEAVIEECIYLNSTALYKVLNVALHERQTVHLLVSKAEKLNRLFPEAEHIERVRTLARLNEPDLYSRLMREKCMDMADAVAAGGKPLNLNENY